MHSCNRSLCSCPLSCLLVCSRAFRCDVVFLWMLVCAGTFLMTAPFRTRVLPRGRRLPCMLFQCKLGANMRRPSVFRQWASPLGPCGETMLRTAGRGRGILADPLRRYCPCTGGALCVVKWSVELVLFHWAWRSTPVSLVVGLRCGCSLSPLTFRWCMEDLASVPREEWQAAGGGARTRHGRCCAAVVGLGRRSAFVRHRRRPVEGDDRVTSEARSQNDRSALRLDKCKRKHTSRDRRPAHGARGATPHLDESMGNMAKRSGCLLGRRGRGTTQSGAPVESAAGAAKPRGLAHVGVPIGMVQRRESTSDPATTECLQRHSVSRMRGGPLVGIAGVDPALSASRAVPRCVPSVSPLPWRGLAWAPLCVRLGGLLPWLHCGPVRRTLGLWFTPDLVLLVFAVAPRWPSEEWALPP